VVLQAELVEHRFLRQPPLAHRAAPPIPRATDSRLHHLANDDLFNGISHLRPC
jgi:hypothetical protein